MTFLEISAKNGKKVNFDGFCTVLARISMRIYPHNEDPYDSFLLMIEDYLFKKAIDYSTINKMDSIIEKRMSLTSRGDKR